MTSVAEKEPEKWCESESGAEVEKGESGQEGRSAESERQGKERRKQVFLNKQKPVKPVRCRSTRRGGKKGN